MFKLSNLGARVGCATCAAGAAAGQAQHAQHEGSQSRAHPLKATGLQGPQGRPVQYLLSTRRQAAGNKEAPAAAYACPASMVKHTQTLPPTCSRRRCRRRRLCLLDGCQLAHGAVHHGRLVVEVLDPLQGDRCQLVVLRCGGQVVRDLDPGGGAVC